MKKLLAICILVACSFVACAGGVNEERSAIEDTIRGYVETYNARDYAQCLTYFTDYGYESSALFDLSYIRDLSGELEFRKIKDVAIADQTATVTVVFVIEGEGGTAQMQLKKIQGQWKILWEQEQGAARHGEAAAIEETIRGYLEAYDAEDFATCLTYLFNYVDSQLVLDSLSWLRGYLGEVNLQWADLSVSSVTATTLSILHQTASAMLRVTALGDSDMDLTMHLKKENGVWKIVKSTGSVLPTLTPTQGFMPGTVDIAPEFQGVVQIKHSFWFELDGILWYWYQIRNIGDQAIDLSIEPQAYNAEGLVFSGGYDGTTVGPGSYTTTCEGIGGEDIGTATHYKIIVKAT